MNQKICDVSFRDSSPTHILFFILFCSFHILEVAKSLKHQWIFTQLSPRCKKQHEEINHVIIQILVPFLNIRYQLNVLLLREVLDFKGVKYNPWCRNSIPLYTPWRNRNLRLKVHIKILKEGSLGGSAG